MGSRGLSRRQFLRVSAGAVTGGGIAAAGVAPASAATVSQIGSSNSANPYARWSNGPNPNGRADYFPLCVWLQSPQNARRYQEIGINCFVGLWQGPTEEQLATLAQYGMRTICAQNDVGLLHKNDPIIMGWLQPDEPDNAQSLPSGGYGPPIPTADIIEAYQQMNAADPTRPVYLGLGQGVANDSWVGRGFPVPWDDYYDYVRGGDITAFDIYPIANGYGPGWLWYPSKGVDRLQMWGERYEKIVWNDIEATNVSTNNYPTPQQVESEVWMSIIHGSRGITYFCHSFVPKFDETGLLDEPDMRAAVATLNARITQLAPVLNSPTLHGAVAVDTSNLNAPVDVLVKQTNGATYVFAACMRDSDTTATFHLSATIGTPHSTAAVLGENRSIGLTGAQFSDEFAPYAVHIYKVSHS